MGSLEDVNATVSRIPGWYQQPRSQISDAPLSKDGLQFVPEVRRIVLGANPMPQMPPSFGHKGGHTASASPKDVWTTFNVKLKQLLCAEAKA